MNRKIADTVLKTATVSSFIMLTLTAIWFSNYSFVLNDLKTFQSLCAVIAFITVFGSNLFLDSLKKRVRHSFYMESQLGGESLRKIWDLLAVFVALLFSLIVWFTYFSAGTYTMNSVIQAGLTWIIGVVIIGVGAKVIGWLLEFFDAVMDAEVKKVAA
jgi:cytochrome c biogenesis protein CcdA